MRESRRSHPPLLSNIESVRVVAVIVGVSGNLGHVTNGPVRGGMVSAQSIIQASARGRPASEVAAYD
jgi:hypothetical protein